MSVELRLCQMRAASWVIQSFCACFTRSLEQVWLFHLTQFAGSPNGASHNACSLSRSVAVSGKAGVGDIHCSSLLPLSSRVMSLLGGALGSRMIGLRKPSMKEESFAREADTLSGMYSSDVVSDASMNMEKRQKIRRGRGFRRPPPRILA